MVVLDAADELGNFFGFQDDNVRNQTEHALFLLANHRRHTKAPRQAGDTGIMPATLELPPSALHSVHAKVFSNYVQWCATMGVQPKFLAKPAGGQESDNYSDFALDLLLHLFVWGEAANLRHMPECLCFLYHKMMQVREYMVHRGPNVAALYPGFYLDHVVAPIYDVVKKAAGSRADHVEKKNYDDFNEFFWSPDCLRYTYRDIDADGQATQDTRGWRRVGGALLSIGGAAFRAVPIARALGAAPKTFVEKRSLLGFLLAFNRLYEFLLVTFHLVLRLAFRYVLLAYQVLPLSTMHRVLTWKTNYLPSSAPAPRPPAPPQVVYFMWSVEKDAYTTGNFSTETQASQPYLYWWWQYLYISSIVVALYLVDGVQQLFPGMTSALLTSRSDYVQAFLNVLVPGSRNYVGKVMHDKQSKTFGYFFFWITLLAWKFYFSYLFEVQSCILPSILYFDDYMNMPDTSLIYNSLMIVLKWVPMVLVYVIDGSIWFSVWVAAVGIWVGYRDRLGDVTNMKTIRAAFMGAPEAFCGKVLHESATARGSYSSSINLIVDDRSNLAPQPLSAAPKSALKNIGESQAAALGAEGEGLGAQNLKTRITEYLDVSTTKWVAFGTAWNEIVNHLRATDTISNQERNMLKFHSFAGFRQPVYLPVFQMAGFVEQAVALFQGQVSLHGELTAQGEAAKAAAVAGGLPALLGENPTMKSACQEAWELAAFLLAQVMGDKHTEDVNAITAAFENWFLNGEILQHIQNHQKLSGETPLGVCKAAPKALPTARRPDTAPESTDFRPPRASPHPTAGAGTAKNSSAELAPELALLRVRRVTVAGGAGQRVRCGPLPAPASVSPAPGHAPAPPEFRDRTRDMLREKLRALLNLVRDLAGGAGAGARGLEVNDRAAFTLSQGFLWDDYYASARLDRLAEDPLALAVTRKLFGLLVVTPQEAEPSSPEAHRRLTYFVNTLFMDLPKAPPLEDMRSWTTMTPFYSEDVLLSKGDLEVRNNEGLTVLTYLQALYKQDWLNFLERNKIEDEAKIYSKQYLQETRLWASVRAQTLARTCEGMMFYEKALRLLGTLEGIPVDRLEKLLQMKFGYVITCQIYGKMKRNQDPKADDIEFLLGRYPNLRVAYIDELRLSREGASDFYSVLIKKDAGRIKEIYRVKLPGNPVMGEGKPENQNHAVVFSRGEYVQAIDMNQDNYFEEALKMRNMLEEFGKQDPDVPITILGFREHIFTGSVSSLANYMALQELSFVTLGQRILNNPLRLRLHYGHPDVFDKLFFMSRGGISKASKGINLSEDIFAGYNNQSRGRQREYKEYMRGQRGDVGMQQIYKFEAKLSQGACRAVSLRRRTVTKAGWTSAG
ncbi:unnamed protein product [Heterosigma akashiwo]